MRKSIFIYVILLCAAFYIKPAMAQIDSSGINKPSVQTSTKNLLSSDTSFLKTFSPRKATIRSAILPGWGQAYNKKYWKIPIVWGALGVSAGIFIFNLKNYKMFKRAVILKLDTIPGNDTLIPADIRVLSPASLQFYRNTYRQDIDYSVLAFLLIWGLNVVDATVDAHLKSFNVSPDLSLKIKPTYYYGSGGALSLVFSLRNKDYHFKMPH